MYDKIFGLEAIQFMIKLSDETEDMETVTIFRDVLIEKVNTIKIMMMAKQWDEIAEYHQVDVAIDCVGVEHASRFMMYMDYLSMKVKAGEFK